MGWWRRGVLSRRLPSGRRGRPCAPRALACTRRGGTGEHDPQRQVVTEDPLSGSVDPAVAARPGATGEEVIELPGGGARRKGKDAVRDFEAHEQVNGRHAGPHGGDRGVVREIGLGLIREVFIRRFRCRSVEVASDEDAVILTCIPPDEVFEQAGLLFSVDWEKASRCTLKS